MAGGLLTTSPWQRGRGRAGGRTPPRPGAGRPGHPVAIGSPVIGTVNPERGGGPPRFWGAWLSRVSGHPHECRRGGPRLHPGVFQPGGGSRLSRCSEAARSPPPTPRWPFGRGLAGRRGSAGSRRRFSAWPVTRCRAARFQPPGYAFPPVFLPSPAGKFHYRAGAAWAGEGRSFRG